MTTDNARQAGLLEAFDMAYAKAAESSQELRNKFDEEHATRGPLEIEAERRGKIRAAFDAWFEEWHDPNVGIVETRIERNAAAAAWAACVSYMRRTESGDDK